MFCHIKNVSYYNEVTCCYAAFRLTGFLHRGAALFFVHNEKNRHIYGGPEVQNITTMDETQNSRCSMCFPKCCVS